MLFNMQVFRKPRRVWICIFKLELANALHKFKINISRFVKLFILLLLFFVSSKPVKKYVDIIKELVNVLVKNLFTRFIVLNSSQIGLIIWGSIYHL